MTDLFDLAAALSRRRKILLQLRTILCPGENKNTANTRLGGIIGKEKTVFSNTESGVGRLVEEDVAKLRAELEKALSAQGEDSLLKSTIEGLLAEREDGLDLRCLSINLRPHIKARNGEQASDSSDAPPEPLQDGDPDVRPTSLDVSLGDRARFTLPRGAVLIVTLTKQGKIISQVS